MKEPFGFVFKSFSRILQLPVADPGIPIGVQTLSGDVNPIFLVADPGLPRGGGVPTPKSGKGAHGARLGYPLEPPLITVEPRMYGHLSNWDRLSLYEHCY